MKEYFRNKLLQGLLQDPDIHDDVKVKCHRFACPMSRQFFQNGKLITEFSFVMEFHVTFGKRCVIM